jgi:hypothetical protein
MIEKRPAQLTRPFRHAIDRQLARVCLAFRVKEIAFVLLGGVIGLFAGIAVVMMARILELMHELLFAIERGTLLGAGPGVGPWRAICVPIVGGLALAIVMKLSGRFRSRKIVDPIEANAIYGGRMSLLDSLGVGLECLISSGSGASSLPPAPDGADRALRCSTARRAPLSRRRAREDRSRYPPPRALPLPSARTRPLPP